MTPSHLAEWHWAREGGGHEPLQPVGTVEVLGVAEGGLSSFELLLYLQLQSNPKNALAPEEVGAVVGFVGFLVGLWFSF